MYSALTWTSMQLGESEDILTSSALTDSTSMCLASTWAWIHDISMCRVWTSMASTLNARYRVAWIRPAEEQLMGPTE